jgi:2-polyprenyl-6-methoxyphenol hydroxylase-like FAD-dependent oxidoreductase
MSGIVVVDGGVIGLSAALIFTKEGYEVTVLERDGEFLPGSADEAWQARGCAVPPAPLPASARV